MIPDRNYARSWVKMFMIRFVPKVWSGSKFTTIRPLPSRPQDWPKPGDTIVARHWSGKPYRSKQQLIMRARIVRVMRVTITADTVVYGDPIREWSIQPVNIKGLNCFQLQTLSRTDGFESWYEMREWFREHGGLPFHGMLVEWDPKTIEREP